MTNDVPAIETATVRTVFWRIVPFLFILYIAAYLDRTNVGLAADHLKKALSLSDAAFGFGAGIFFIGYFLFEVPSNLILERVGARRWIARIMISWGIISSAMMFAWDEWSFYALRFLLGVAEAGFFPGMILYLSYWFPIRHRAKVVARFMTAIAISNIIGAPLANWIYKLDGVSGLAGWQWLFLLEGIPSVLLGIAVLFVLIDRPADAKWMSDEQRAWLSDALARDRAEVEKRGKTTLSAAFTEPRVYWLIALYLTNVIGNYGLSLWMQQIFKAKGFSPSTAIWLCMVPYVCAAVCMVLVGNHSDKTGERRWHFALPQFIAGAALLTAGLTDNAWLAVGCLSIAAMGTLSALGPFWTFPASFLAGTAAAGGIAVINSAGNLGGFLGPWTVGLLAKKPEDGVMLTSHFFGGLCALAATLTIGGILALRFPIPKPARPAVEAPPEPVTKAG